MSVSIHDFLAATAEKEVGIRESPINSNRGPKVDEYKAATWLPAKKAWPWCAAFICWLVLQAVEKGILKETKTFKRPRTAGAWDLANWALKQDDTIRTKTKPGDDIAKGDIIVFTFSHCGLAVMPPDKAGYFYAVEGNTDASGSREGGGVYLKRRHVSQVKSRHRFA